MPLFSVIIPTHNRAATVTRALDSVLNQTYGDWEAIVVDDASSDHTSQELSRYADPRIKVLVNEQNMERSASRNRGMAQAEGIYFCFLDSDDYYEPVYLQRLYETVQRHHRPVALLHCDVQVVDHYGRLIRREGYAYPEGGSAVEAVMRHHIPTSAVTIHRRLAERFQFDPALNINEDVYFFALCVSSFELIHLREPLIAWVMHDSNTAQSVQDVIAYELKATDRMLSDPRIRSKVSNAYIKNKYSELYTRLVHHYASRGQMGKAVYFLCKHLVLHPGDANNRNNLLNVVYHLPGGNVLKQWIGTWKR